MVTRRNCSSAPTEAPTIHANRLVLLTARRKRFELAIMLSIIPFPFNIPRDGGEVECHGACPRHPRLATALHLQECVEFAEAKDRLLQISGADHFRTRLPQ